MSDELTYRLADYLIKHITVDRSVILNFLNDNSQKELLFDDYIGNIVFMSGKLYKEAGKINVIFFEEIGWLDMNVRGINLWENCVYCNDAEWARTPQWFFLKRTKIKI